MTHTVGEPGSLCLRCRHLRDLLASPKAMSGRRPTKNGEPIDFSTYPPLPGGIYTLALEEKP